MPARQQVALNAVQERRRAQKTGLRSATVPSPAMIPVMTGSWGYFDGEGALAFSAAARMDHNWSASWALGIAPEGGQVGARAGVRFGW